MKTNVFLIDLSIIIDLIFLFIYSQLCLKFKYNYYSLKKKIIILINTFIVYLINHRQVSNFIKYVISITWMHFGITRSSIFFNYPTFLFVAISNWKTCIYEFLFQVINSSISIKLFVRKKALSKNWF